MPLLKHVGNLRPQFQLFLWSYAPSDGKQAKLEACVDYGKELAKAPATLKGQLSVMAFLKWYFGATPENQLVVDRNRNGIWAKTSEGHKQHGQLFKLNWSHHKEVAAILLWTGESGSEKLAPWFGVDLEPTERSVFLDTLFRVLNDDEQRLHRRYAPLLEANVRFWCAKEALYKAGQSDMGIRLGSTVEVLPTEHDQGQAIIHQFRRSSNSYKANLHCNYLNQYTVISAFLHLKPIGQDVYKDLPLFGPIKRR